MSRWWKLAGTTLGLLLTAIGLAGVPSELETWSKWVRLIDLEVVRWVLALGGVVLLVAVHLPTAFRRMWDEAVSLRWLIQTIGFHRLRPSEAKGPYFRGNILRLVDVTDKWGRIDGYTFEQCHIYGPAIIWPTGVGGFLDCEFSDSGGAVLVEIPRSQEGIVGAVVTINCNFRGCVFHGIGIAGYDEAIRSWRQGLKESGGRTIG